VPNYPPVFHLSKRRGKIKPIGRFYNRKKITYPKNN
jgi:hypothetical protein